MLRPTPPAPNTTTDSPIFSLALFCATPKPVVTAQPKSAAISRSLSAGMTVTRFSDTIACWLNVVIQPAFSFFPRHWYESTADSMPRPFLQCNTTLSPGSAWRTPGPHSSTTPEPSWPRRCGRNLSSPLAPSISPSCEPQTPLAWISTSTCPASSFSGSAISSITSGFFNSTRIAARVFDGRLMSFEVNEGMVAGIAGLAEPPFPFRRGIERFAGHLPVEQVRLFHFVAIRLHADVFVLSPDSLDLSQRLVQVV